MQLAVPNPQPGDCLLYNTPGDFVDWAIRVKTWSIAAHVECCVGNGQSVASRATGVNIFPYRPEGLVAILRPSQPFDLAKALAWFNASAKGQRYDWKGLLCFALAVHQGSKDKMFCSEFATRFYRAGGLNAVNANWDADKVAPGSFLMTPALDWVWVNQ